MELILKKLGHKAVLFDNGADALSYLKDHCLEIDIILSDLMMPGMHGTEFVKKLKQSTKFKHIPVVMQSGHTNSAEISETIYLGAERKVIAKPYMKKEIEDAIDCLYMTVEKNKKLFKAKSSAKVKLNV